MIWLTILVWFLGNTDCLDELLIFCNYMYNEILLFLSLIYSKKYIKTHFVIRKYAVFV